MLYERKLYGYALEELRMIRNPVRKILGIIMDKNKEVNKK
jgi:hypothetical protein